MPDDGTFYICEGCRQPVAENDPDVLRAVSLITARSMGGTDEPVEGLGVFFHKRCWSPSSRYRLSD